MSFNIRLDVKSDGENWWELRKEKVASLINHYEADFIGGQEVQHHQLKTLNDNMPLYQYIGVGRDDGKEAGEYSCIWYKKGRFEVIKQNTFWLSESPDSVSRGWDAACHRVCTYGLFIDKKTKKKVWVFNTHLDHLGVLARLNSVKLIADKIATLTKNDKTPIIVMGDFNSKQHEDPYRYFASKFFNSRDLCNHPYGPIDTWNGFKFEEVPKGCIDYIFVKGKCIVRKFATITDSYEKKYPSDHFPILAEIEWN